MRVNFSHWKILRIALKLQSRRLPPPHTKKINKLLKRRNVISMETQSMFWFKKICPTGLKNIRRTIIKYFCYLLCHWVWGVSRKVMLHQSKREFTEIYRQAIFKTWFILNYINCAWIQVHVAVKSAPIHPKKRLDILIFFFN